MNKISKILLVDDETNILEIFSAMMRDIGYSVKTSSKPEEALSFIAEDSFDIAFIDQFLGDKRGLDLIQQMSEIDPALYYVIITGNGDTNLAVESLKKGASDFITKPFFVGDLIKSIEYVEKKRELEKKKAEIVSMLESKVNEKTEELRKVYFSVLSSLTQAMEKRDIWTYGHSRRVSHYSRLIAAALDLREEDRENLKAVAILHDIGKIGISDFILGKRGPLDESEKDAIKNHPKKGVEILKPLEQAFGQLKCILPAILHHHENYDGSGYPDGLSGEEIPLLSRIITVADTYDAISSNRAYRSASTHEEAISELLRCSGRQFDPKIINAFVDADNKYRRRFAGN